MFFPTVMWGLLYCTTTVFTFGARLQVSRRADSRVDTTESGPAGISPADSKQHAAQAAAERTALEDLYTQLGGDGWYLSGYDPTNWMTAEPVCTWP